MVLLSCRPRLAARVGLQMIFRRCCTPIFKILMNMLLAQIILSHPLTEVGQDRGPSRRARSRNDFAFLGALDETLFMP